MDFSLPLLVSSVTPVTPCLSQPIAVTVQHSLSLTNPDTGEIKAL